MKTKEETRFEMVKERHKKTFFDAVKQGKADSQIIPFCRFISKTKNFFTSSSCAGRIVLLDIDKEGNKKEAAFHAKWHRKISFKELMKEINKQNSEEELWFKLDPFILHLGTDSLENAKKVLEAAKTAGIRRAGIMVAVEGKFITELIGTQSIAFPVKIKGEIITEKKFLEKALEKANKKLEKNYFQFKEFEKTARKKLK